MRLLIVEDDRKLAEFVARGLRSEDYAVDLAADGREGLKCLEAYPGSP
jgi:two-component system copper resistance phosphate regulon response regulator CusR